MLTWKCLHLYADEQGVTRVDPEFSFQLQEVPFAPPAPSVFVARAPSASGIVFIELPIGWKGGWHPSPKVQWVICLSGRMGFETGDGTRFELEPGSHIFSSDVSGVGHNSWNAGDEPVRLAVVQAQSALQQGGQLLTGWVKREYEPIWQGLTVAGMERPMGTPLRKRAGHQHPMETAMPAAMVQYVFKPNPGCDMSALMDLIKESAGMWRKHGAEVSLWGVQVGEVGNMAFAARCESTAKLGAVLDALNNDPAFAAWRMKSLKANLSTWVRSNQAYEVPIPT